MKSMGDKLDGSRGSDTLEAHKAIPRLWQSNCPTFQPMLQARLLSFEEIPTFLNTYWRGCSERDESQPVQSKPACPESMARYSSFFLHADIRFRTILPRIGSRLVSASHRVETDDVDAARREHQQRQVVWNAPSVVVWKPSLKRHPLSVRIVYLIGLVRPP